MATTEARSPPPPPRPMEELPPVSSDPVDRAVPREAEVPRDPLWIVSASSELLLLLPRQLPLAALLVISGSLFCWIGRRGVEMVASSEDDDSAPAGTVAARDAPLADEDTAGGVAAGLRAARTVTASSLLDDDELDAVRASSPEATGPPVAPPPVNGLATIGVRTVSSSPDDVDGDADICDFFF